MMQSASGRERVSWDSARVSAAMRVRNPKDKRLFFMSLWGFCFACKLQAWRKVGANGWVWQQQKCAFFARLVRGCARVAASMDKKLATNGSSYRFTWQGRLHPQRGHPHFV